MALPGFLRSLDRKLLRDLWAMKGQAFAIALVVAGGVAVHLVAEGMLTSLAETRRAYYERYRFADVWAPVVRAPDALIRDVRRIPGVIAAESRVRSRALIDIPTMDEPATGEIFSLPDNREPSVNNIYLVRGRLPHPEGTDEAVVLEGFALSHGLEIGDTVATTVYGGRRDLRIVGIGLSPEHVYAIAPGQIVPDARLFGVFWMSRTALAQSVNQDGAFNEAVVRLAPGFSEQAVIESLDRLLEPYGAPGAYGRDEQISDAFVSSEIDQLEVIGDILPPVFLLVAAFLVNVVISRLIATERSQIGLMKAFGYSDFAVAAHYLKLVGTIALIGLLLGIGAGAWMGRALALLYIEYYRFPFLLFEVNPRVFALVIAISLIAIGGGALFAVRRAVSLDPATAMTPPPPPDYSKAVGTRITNWRLLDQQSRMILRQIVRWPGRAAFTVMGVAASVALLIGTMFFLDAMEAMMTDYFEIANPLDVQVSFIEPRSRAAYFDLIHAPGVLEAEPFRTVAARLRYGHREERAALTGLVVDARLARTVDTNGDPVVPPPGGLVLSRDLAEKLGIEAGGSLEVEVTEGRRPHFLIPVSAVTTTYIGSGVHMQIGDLNEVMREGPAISGANLMVDSKHTTALYRELKASPVVAGVNLQKVAYRNFVEVMDQNIGVSIWMYTAFAALIAIGVVYNSVRISFAERTRELASLRVLGFTRGEVSYILLGEIAFLTLLALPIGAGLGSGLALYLARAVSSDLFRVPFIIEPATFGYAGAVVIVITAISGLLVRRELDRMDLISVLKTRE
jgi:putative ABC transport system permease protein